jgi:Fe2+ transport system protein B
MIKIDKKTKEQLLEIYKTKKISLEGNILKIIDTEGDIEFENYIKESIEKDKDNRRKRLDVTRQVQSQNKDLTSWKEENERVNAQLKVALEEAEFSKQEAINAKEQAEKSRDEAESARLEAEKSRHEAEVSKEEAMKAKMAAENDLDLLQKKTQFELIGSIIRVALWVILGVGIVTTVIYLVALLSGVDTAVIGSTWSNIIGILLTNSFSIVGTIMGVKYASDKKE